jgi:hypothetical protein
MYRRGDQVRAMHQLWSRATGRTMHEVRAGFWDRIGEVRAQNTLAAVQRIIARPTGGCREATFEDILALFSHHWPDSLPWPEDIPRPMPARPAEARP